MEKEEKYKKFLDWIVSNGGLINSTNFPVDFSGVIGVEAKQDIGPNEAIFYIPKKLIIDSAMIKDKIFYSFYMRNKELIRKKYDRNNLINFTLFLISESCKGESSFWQPYISLIPDPDIPIVWNSHELKEIQDDNFIKCILIDKKLLEEIYKDLKECFLNELTHNYITQGNYKIYNKEFFSSFTIDSFIKFYVFSMTRNFHASENQSYLVPFAENLNHGEVNINYEIFDSENMVTKLTIEDGETTEPSELYPTQQLLFHKNKPKNEGFYQLLLERKENNINKIETNKKGIIYFIKSKLAF